MHSTKCRNAAGPFTCALIGLAFLTLGASAIVADDPAKFDSAEAAVTALIDATQSGEKAALAKVFGSVAGDLCSGDEEQDKEDLARFARRLSAANKLVKNDDGTMTLQVGKTGHPFPILLTQKDGKWFFDTAAGKEEILNRRIGDNELRTIAACRGYVVAQREYFESDPDDDDLLEYAQRFSSTPGKKDGLFWETTDDEPPSPLGPLVAEARAEGHAAGKDVAGTTLKPYHGYLYKIVTKQGAKAPGGKFDYVINGHMVAGFALVAWPAQYGKSGVMTFQVNTNGKVLEKDLGERTAELAAAMSEYDLDESWKPAKD